MGETKTPKVGKLEKCRSFVEAHELGSLSDGVDGATFGSLDDLGCHLNPSCQRQP